MLLFLNVWNHLIERILKMSNVLLCVSSSVSCELFYKLQKELEKDNEVKVIFTEHAMQILNQRSNNKVTLLELFKELKTTEWKYNKYSVSFPSVNNDKGGYDHEVYLYKENNKVEHIELIEWADKLVIAPCTGNLLGKIVNGIADDFVSTTIMAYIGTNKPLYIAPAMNTNMWKNIFVQENINKLLSRTNSALIYPTVKKLACGSLGIGALAYIGTIVNIVNGHRWGIPINTISLNDSKINFFNNISFNEYIPKYYEPGSFGFQRKFEIHNGVDIYCKDGSNVHAVEDGIVVAIKQFTGRKLNMDWWLDTWAICVKGKSGVVCYGEMGETFNFNVGDNVKRNDILGKIKAVLPIEKIRYDIRNHNNAMLHIQLFKDYVDDDQLLNWYPNKERNKILLDPTPYLQLINNFK